MPRSWTRRNRRCGLTPPSRSSRASGSRAARARSRCRSRCTGEWPCIASASRRRLQARSLRCAIGDASARTLSVDPALLRFEVVEPPPVAPHVPPVPKRQVTGTKCGATMAHRGDGPCGRISAPADVGVAAGLAPTEAERAQARGRRKRSVWAAVKPLLQRHRVNTEVSRDLLDRHSGLAAPRDAHHVVTELARVGLSLDPPMDGALSERRDVEMPL
jgi:hypothetical protein